MAVADDYNFPQAGILNVKMGTGYDLLKMASWSSNRCLKRLYPIQDMNIVKSAFTVMLVDFRKPRKRSGPADI